MTPLTTLAAFSIAREINSNIATASPPAPGEAPPPINVELFKAIKYLLSWDDLTEDSKKLIMGTEIRAELRQGGVFHGRNGLAHAWIEKSKVLLSLLQGLSLQLTPSRYNDDEPGPPQTAEGQTRQGGRLRQAEEGARWDPCAA